MKFEDKVAQLYPWILRMAKRYSKSKEDAEDLAGETVYKVLSNRSKYDEDMDLKPWCLAIMANTSKTIHQHNSLITFVDYDCVHQAPSYNRASERVTLKNIFSCVRKSARRTSTILCVLYYAKGYSYDEISSIVGIPVGTVKSRISFGRKVLKVALEL